MNTNTDAAKTISHERRIRRDTAPSLRVPVTAGNRALLRRLRSAELSAWEAADYPEGSAPDIHAQAIAMAYASS